MHIGKGETSIASPIGACFSVFIQLIVLVYAAEKFRKMVTGQGFSITLSELTDYFDHRETITTKDGFNVAFAMIDASDSDRLFDSSYFSFEVWYGSWWEDESGELLQDYQELSLHRCSK